MPCGWGWGAKLTNLWFGAAEGIAPKDGHL
jgi:hypothetical protein